MLTRLILTLLAVKVALRVARARDLAAATAGYNAAIRDAFTAAANLTTDRKES